MYSATTADQKPALNLLFLCTGNSARSQIGEATLTRKGRDRFLVACAGSQPAPPVNPLTVEGLSEFGIDWSRREPKGIHAVTDRESDLLITVCDQAKGDVSSVPRQAGSRALGMPDPAAVVGSDDVRREAFRDTVHYLSRRIEVLLALPVEKLERLALEQRVRHCRRGAAERATTRTPDLNTCATL